MSEHHSSQNSARLMRKSMVTITKIAISGVYAEAYHMQADP